MQHKPQKRSSTLFSTVLIWLCGVAVLFLIKAAIEFFEGPIAETWIDLTLVLVAYLFFFLLRPLQNWISKRARRRSQLHRPDQPI